MDFNRKIKEITDALADRISLIPETLTYSLIPYSAKRKMTKVLPAMLLTNYCEYNPSENVFLKDLSVTTRRRNVTLPKSTSNGF